MAGGGAPPHASRRPGQDGRARHNWGLQMYRTAILSRRANALAEECPDISQVPALVAVVRDAARRPSDASAACEKLTALLARVGPGEQQQAAVEDIVRYGGLDAAIDCFVHLKPRARPALAPAPAPAPAATAPDAQLQPDSEPSSTAALRSAPAESRGAKEVTFSTVMPVQPVRTVRRQASDLDWNWIAASQYVIAVLQCDVVGTTNELISARLGRRGSAAGISYDDVRRAILANSDAEASGRAHAVWLGGAVPQADGDSGEERDSFEGIGSEGGPDRRGAPLSHAVAWLALLAAVSNSALEQLADDGPLLAWLGQRIGAAPRPWPALLDILGFVLHAVSCIARAPAEASGRALAGVLMQPGAVETLATLLADAAGAGAWREAAASALHETLLKSDSSGSGNVIASQVVAQMSAPAIRAGALQFVLSEDSSERGREDASRLLCRVCQIGGPSLQRDVCRELLACMDRFIAESSAATAAAAALTTHERHRGSEGPGAAGGVAASGGPGSHTSSLSESLARGRPGYAWGPTQAAVIDILCVLTGLRGLHEDATLASAVAAAMLRVMADRHACGPADAPEDSTIFEQLVTPDRPACGMLVIPGLANLSDSHALLRKSIILPALMRLIGDCSGGAGGLPESAPRSPSTPELQRSISRLTPGRDAGIACAAAALAAIAEHESGRVDLTQAQAWTVMTVLLANHAPASQIGGLAMTALLRLSDHPPALAAMAGTDVGLLGLLRALPADPPCPMAGELIRILDKTGEAAAAGVPGTPRRAALGGNGSIEGVLCMRGGRHMQAVAVAAPEGHRRLTVASAAMLFARAAHREDRDLHLRMEAMKEIGSLVATRIENAVVILRAGGIEASLRLTAEFWHGSTGGGGSWGGRGRFSEAQAHTYLLLLPSYVIATCMVVDGPRTSQRLRGALQTFACYGRATIGESLAAAQADPDQLMKAALLLHASRFCSEDYAEARPQIRAVIAAAASAGPSAPAGAAASRAEFACLFLAHLALCCSQDVLKALLADGLLGLATVLAGPASAEPAAAVRFGYIGLVLHALQTVAPAEVAAAVGAKPAARAGLLLPLRERLAWARGPVTAILSGGLGLCTELSRGELLAEMLGVLRSQVNVSTDLCVVAADVIDTLAGTITGPEALAAAGALLEELLMPVGKANKDVAAGAADGGQQWQVLHWRVLATSLVELMANSAAKGHAYLPQHVLSEVTAFHGFLQHAGAQANAVGDAAVDTTIWRKMVSLILYKAAGVPQLKAVMTTSNCVSVLVKLLRVGDLGAGCRNPEVVLRTAGLAMSALLRLASHPAAFALMSSSPECPVLLSLLSLTVTPDMWIPKLARALLARISVGSLPEAATPQGARKGLRQVALAAVSPAEMPSMHLDDASNSESPTSSRSSWRILTGERFDRLERGHGESSSAAGPGTPRRGGAGSAVGADSLSAPEDDDLDDLESTEVSWLQLENTQDVLAQVPALLKTVAAGGHEAHASCLKLKSFVDQDGGPVQACILANNGLKVLAQFFLERRPPRYALEHRFGAFAVLQQLILNDLTGTLLLQIGPMIASLGYVPDPETCAGRIYSANDADVDTGVFDLIVISLDHRHQPLILNRPRLVAWLIGAIHIKDGQTLSNTTRALNIATLWALYEHEGLMTALHEGDVYRDLMAILVAAEGAGFSAPTKALAIAILSGLVTDANNKPHPQRTTKLAEMVGNAAVRAAMREVIVEMQQPAGWLNECYIRVCTWGLKNGGTATASALLSEQVQLLRTRRTLGAAGGLSDFRVSSLAIPAGAGTAPSQQVEKVVAAQVISSCKAMPSVEVAAEVVASLVLLFIDAETNAVGSRAAADALADICAAAHVRHLALSLIVPLAQGHWPDLPAADAMLGAESFNDSNNSTNATPRASTDERGHAGRTSLESLNRPDSLPTLLSPPRSPLPPASSGPQPCRTPSDSILASLTLMAGAVSPQTRALAAQTLYKLAGRPGVKDDLLSYGTVGAMLSLLENPGAYPDAAGLAVGVCVRLAGHTACLKALMEGRVADLVRELVSGPRRWPPWVLSSADMLMKVIRMKGGRRLSNDRPATQAGPGSRVSSSGPSTPRAQGHVPVAAASSFASTVTSEGHSSDTTGTIDELAEASAFTMAIGPLGLSNLGRPVAAASPRVGAPAPRPPVPLPTAAVPPGAVAAPAPAPPFPLPAGF